MHSSILNSDKQKIQPIFLAIRVKSFNILHVFINTGSNIETRSKWWKLGRVNKKFIRGRSKPKERLTFGNSGKTWKKEKKKKSSRVVIEPENNNRVSGDYLLDFVKSYLQLFFTEFVWAEPGPHDLA